MDEAANTGGPAHADVRLALGLLLLGVAAYAALPAMPLYFDNQNTKFLYGLAKAGVGRLADDWEVRQGSELPIFDALVYLTYHFVGPWGFYAWQFVFVAIYAAGAYGFARVVGLTKPELFGPNGRWFLPIFGALWIGLMSNRATLKAFEGFAVQYINGMVFETQSVGVLTFVGLLLFRLRQTGWGVVLMVAAAWVHPAYAIPGLMLLLGMTVARWRCGATVSLPPLAIAAGVVGCLGAAGFAYSLLQPSDPAIQAEAIRIITEIRIPYHALPKDWLDDSDTYLKLAAVLLAIWLARRDPLAWVMGVVLACIAVLTAWVYFAHDLELALASPWRASAIIVPVANTILLGRLIQAAAGWSEDVPWRRAAVLGVAAAAIVVGIGLGQRGRLMLMEERQHPAYFAWVRDNARDGDLFLTPVNHGDFRLATGQPQYISWKTHPYRGESVLEWYRRLKSAGAATGRQPGCETLDAFAAHGVTHLVRDASFPPPDCPGWHAVYDDGKFAIFTTRE
jgi:hypothetical protein